MSSFQSLSIRTLFRFDYLLHHHICVCARTCVCVMIVINEAQRKMQEEERQWFSLIRFSFLISDHYHPHRIDDVLLNQISPSLSLSLLSFSPPIRWDRTWFSRFSSSAWYVDEDNNQDQQREKRRAREQKNNNNKEKYRSRSISTDDVKVEVNDNRASFLYSPLSYYH